MPQDTELDQLGARWHDQHERAVFAALADALRKRGDTARAREVLRDGLDRYPAHLPGHVALARLRWDAGDLAGALEALSRVLELDASHPWALSVRGDLQDAVPRQVPDRAVPEPNVTAGAVPPAVAAPDPAVSRGGQPRDDDPADGASDEAPFDDPSEPLLTESLAMLYHRQGHHDRALEVFEALLVREPGNVRLRTVRDTVRAEVAVRRPRPYDAATSGGRSVASWLGAIAATRPEQRPPASAYDAFFREPAGAGVRGEDNLEAFQRWLRELDR